MLRIALKIFLCKSSTPKNTFLFFRFSRFWYSSSRLQKPRKNKKQKCKPHAKYWDMGSAILFFWFCKSLEKPTKKSINPMPDTGTWVLPFFIIFLSCGFSMFYNVKSARSGSPALKKNRSAMDTAHHIHGFADALAQCQFEHINAQHSPHVFLLCVWNNAQSHAHTHVCCKDVQRIILVKPACHWHHSTLAPAISLRLRFHGRSGNLSVGSRMSCKVPRRLKILSHLVGPNFSSKSH